MQATKQEFHLMQCSHGLEAISLVVHIDLAVGGDLAVCAIGAENWLLAA